MRIPTAELLKPTNKGSVLLVGDAGTGKTYSIATLRRWLRLHSYPTKILYFDFDGDGSDTLLSLARDGRESFDKSNRVPPWVEDIELHRYQKLNLNIGLAIGSAATAPSRDAGVAAEFHKDFN